MTRPAPGERNPSRPSDLSRREAIQAGVGGLLASTVPVTANSLHAESTTPPENPPAANVEWRNQQAGMAYRRLGRTGLMVSEVVSGGDPINLDNYKHLDRALERGLNYLDMAPMYGDGACEQAIGKLLAGSSNKRDKVFLTTKMSGFTGQREGMYRDIFNGLPPTKQDAIMARAQALRNSRGVDAPGYYMTYYPGQQEGFEPAYLRVAMREEYGAQVEGSPSFQGFIQKTLEGSLKRVGTDHFDIIMCPHGANAPEDLDAPEIIEAFNDLKRQGKVRFLGVTSHNDPSGILRAAVAAGHYDLVMCAYNVINGGYVDEAIRQAAASEVGIIAMKVAMAVATHHTPLQPTPQWRIDKVNKIVPGDWKAPQKAYLWSLQNPRITAVISNLWNETFIDENLSLAGIKVELQPA